MNSKTAAKRYHLAPHQATELLEMVDEMFEIDYSEMSWKEIDTFMSMAATRLGMEISRWPGDLI